MQNENVSNKQMDENDERSDAYTKEVHLNWKANPVSSSVVKFNHSYPVGSTVIAPDITKNGISVIKSAKIHHETNQAYFVGIKDGVEMTFFFSIDEFGHLSIFK